MGVQSGALVNISHIPVVDMNVDMTDELKSCFSACKCAQWLRQRYDVWQACPDQRTQHKNL